MPRKTAKQATIIERLDYTLELMTAKGMVPRAIYLNAEDRAEFDAIATERWRRETGSEAFVCQSSYNDTIIVNGKGVQAMVKARWIPLRKFNGLGKQSIIYSKRGVGVCVRKAVP